MKVFTLRNQFIENELRNNGIEVHVHSFKKINFTRPELKAFLTKVHETQPDIFFMWKDQQLTPEVLKHVKRIAPKAKLVMWWGDQRGAVVPPLIKGRARLLDALLMTNGDPAQVKLFRAAGIPKVLTFYHAISDTEFQLFPTPITHEVFFGGNRFNPLHFPLVRLRTQLINEVHKNFKLLVHGNNWPFPTEKIVLRPQYARVLRKAYINLGINHYDTYRYYNRRLWECMASGRMHMTYYVPGMEKDFVNKKHLVWFKSVPQAITLIRYYLDHPEAREAVAQEGRKLVLEKHSWPVRTKELIDLFNKIV